MDNGATCRYIVFGFHLLAVYFCFSICGRIGVIDAEFVGAFRRQPVGYPLTAAMV